MVPEFFDEGYQEKGRSVLLPLVLRDVKRRTQGLKREEADDDIPHKVLVPPSLDAAPRESP
jgi:hypothetical protein